MEEYTQQTWALGEVNLGDLKEERKRLRLKKIKKRKRTALNLLKWFLVGSGTSVLASWIGIEYSTQLIIVSIFVGFMALTIGLLILISYLERKKQEKKVEEYSKKLKDVNQEVLINILKSKGSGER